MRFVKVLTDAKMSKRDVDEVVLVGGSTRIPKVQELIKASGHTSSSSDSMMDMLRTAAGASNVRQLALLLLVYALCPACLLYTSPSPRD